MSRDTVGRCLETSLHFENRRHDDRGRFCGCGTTNPRRDRIRHMVETAGTGCTPAFPRWTAMVTAPGVQTVLRQLFAEPDDLVLDLQADRSRVGTWTAVDRVNLRVQPMTRVGPPALGCEHLVWPDQHVSLTGA